MTGPTCSKCERDLPSLDSVCISVGPDEFATCELFAVTFHVRCVCGEETGLRIRTGERVS